MLARFVTGPLWAYAAAGALLAGFAGGWTVRAWKCDAALAGAMQAAEKQRQQYQDRMAEHAIQFEEQRDDAANASTARERGIRTIYRDKVVPADCAADPGARGLLAHGVERANGAARGEPVAPLPGVTVAP